MSSSRYAIVRDSDGLIENIAMWDGVAAWSPPPGTTAVLDSTPEAIIDGRYQASTFYGPTPAIDSIDPVTGVAAGGETVTITGYNLDLSDITVKFDGVAATNIANQTKTSLQCDTPAHAAGAVDVTIENGEGLWTGRSTLSGGFTYS